MASIALPACPVSLSPRSWWERLIARISRPGFPHPAWGWQQLSAWPGVGFADGYPGGHISRAWFNTGRGGNGSAPEEPPSEDAAKLPFYHESVLLKEVVEWLQPGPGKIYLDVTLGGGGHTEALLQRGAKVVAMDQDPVAIAYATSRLRCYADRFCAIRGNFRNFPDLLKEIGVGKFDGIIADIGVSTRQLSDASKGFSFQKDGPLDLRMDPDAPITAADLINTMSEEELIRIFIDYGEEPHARRIARAIVKHRAAQPIRTTLQLAAIIESVSPRKGHRHPATLVFQAMRIAVNDELAALEDFLDAAPAWLKPSGRVAVISFHSLEDRVAKRRFQHFAAPYIDRPEFPEPRPNADHCLRVLTRKPVEPSDAEITSNPRSRSARLRVAERLPEP